MLDGTLRWDGDVAFRVGFPGLPLAAARVRSERYRLERDDRARVVLFLRLR